MSLRSALAPAAKQTIKGVAGLADLLRRDRGGITILIYHRVGTPTGSEMTISPQVFDEQLAWLTEHHTVLSLDEALVELAAGSAASTAEPSASPAEPARSRVVVTFDDGTVDWVDEVLPALERHHVPATFYVATDFVERAVPFPSDGTPISWSGLTELATSELVTIGSHTHTHALLDRLPAAQIGGELDRSTELLGERLDLVARHFCYPKAVAGSAAAEAAVRQRFDSAVLAGTRPNLAGADPYRLTRSPIQHSDGTRWFRRKSAGGMRFEDDLRRGINRARYRGLSS